VDYFFQGHRTEQHEGWKSMLRMWRGYVNITGRVWRVLVESLDEMQQKLAREEVSDVQMSSFTLLIQVCLL